MEGFHSKAEEAAASGDQQAETTPAHSKPSATAPPPGPPDLRRGSPDSSEESSQNEGIAADQVDYALQYPDLHSTRRVSWQQAIKADDFVTETVQDEEGDNLYVTDDDQLDEFHEMPSCRGVVEWINCLIFDCILLLIEVATSLWLASSLHEVEYVGAYRAIVVILVLPCLINPMLWVSMYQSYRAVTHNPLFVLGITALGFPSPFFIYIWHLYLSMFSSRKNSMQSRQLANTFRMSQAFVSSVPLLLINVVTLINALKDENTVDRNSLHATIENSANLEKLGDHMGTVKMHALAFVVSFFNLLRASSLFNERQTFTLLFILVGFPFILLTLITRITMLAVVSAFLKAEWTAIILLGLTFMNILLYLACRKRRIYYAPPSKHASSKSGGGVGGKGGGGGVKYSKSNTTEQDFEMVVTSSDDGTSSENCATCCTGGGADEGVTRGGTSRAGVGPPPITFVADDASDFCTTCCSTRNRSYTYAMDTDNDKPSDKPGYVQVDESVRGSMLKTIALSFLSIVMPASYANDGRCHHPRLKGGLYLMLNYLTNMTILGVSLGYTILHHAPNLVKGLVLHNPNVNIEMPPQNIKVGMLGINVVMKMPHSIMNPGEMPGANLNIEWGEEQDLFLAIVVPILLSLMVLPFVTMRSAMMEMDCFVASKKLLDVIDVESYVHKKNKMARKRRSSSSAGTQSTSTGSGQDHLHIGRVSLLDTIARNTDSREIKSRVYTTICCGLCGMGIMVMVFMFMGALVFSAFYLVAA